MDKRLNERIAKVEAEIKARNDQGKVISDTLQTKTKTKAKAKTQSSSSNETIRSTILQNKNFTNYPYPFYCESLPLNFPFHLYQNYLQQVFELQQLQLQQPYSPISVPINTEVFKRNVDQAIEPRSWSHLVSGNPNNQRAGS